MDTTLEREGDRYRLVVRRELAHPAEKVWRVLTEGPLAEQWFPARIEGEWRVGAPLRFEFLHGGGADLTEEEMTGEVLSCEPPRSLSFRWGTHEIRYELAELPGGCLLELSEVVRGPEWGARNAAGWEMCLENLDLILEGAGAAKFIAKLWWSKFDHYAEEFGRRFGPQMGPPEDHPLLQDDDALTGQ